MPFPIFSLTAISSFSCLSWGRQRGGHGGVGGDGGGVELENVYIRWSNAETLAIGVGVLSVDSTPLVSHPCTLALLLNAGM